MVARSSITITSTDEDDDDDDEDDNDDELALLSGVSEAVACCSRSNIHANDSRWYGRNTDMTDLLSGGWWAEMPLSKGVTRLARNRSNNVESEKVIEATSERTERWCERAGIEAGEKTGPEMMPKVGVLIPLARLSSTTMRVESSCCGCCSLMREILVKTSSMALARVATSSPIASRSSCCATSTAHAGASVPGADTRATDEKR